MKIDPVVQAAELLDQVYRRELELLASITNGPRQGLAMLDAAGITVDSFSEDDSRALYLALHEAGDGSYGRKPWSKGEIARACKVCLEACDRWRETETRAFVVGHFWGAPALVHFLTAVPFHVATVRTAIDKLKAAWTAVEHFNREAA